MAKRPALIIFDVDGTLFETHRVTVPAVQRTFARFGLTKPAAEDILRFFGRPVSEYEAWITAQCPAHLASEVLAATNTLELALIGETGRLYPGVREMLDALCAQGHVLAICSNGPDDYVAEFMRAHRLQSYFPSVLSRGMRSAAKPAMVGALINAHPGRPAIVVGDRLDDIDAAHAHGGWAIAAAYGFGAPEEHVHADARAAVPAEIPAAVAHLLDMGSSRAPDNLPP